MRSAEESRGSLAAGAASIIALALRGHDRGNPSMVARHVAFEAGPENAPMRRVMLEARREVRSASVWRRQCRALHDPFQRVQFIVGQSAQITSHVEVDGL
jgi:hypothetical protein